MRWQWHQLGYMQIICTSLQRDNNTSTSSLSILQSGCSSWRPTDSVRALEAYNQPSKCQLIQRFFNKSSQWQVNTFKKPCLKISLELCSTNITDFQFRCNVVPYYYYITKICRLKSGTVSNGSPTYLLLTSYITKFTSTNTHPTKRCTFFTYLQQF